MIKRLSTLFATVVLSMSAHAVPVVFDTISDLGFDEKNGTLDMFDTNGGQFTMTSARIHVTGVISPTVTLTNTQDVGGVPTVDLESSYLASLTFDFPLLGVSSYLVTELTTDFLCQSGNASGDTCPGVGGAALDSFFDVFYDVGANAAEFAILKNSAGPLNFSCRLDVVDNSPKSQSTDVSASTEGSCTASVVYEFVNNQPNNGVPEPGTLALVGLSMAAMGLTARRRKLQGQH